MAEGKRAVYSDPGPETWMKKFDGMPPTTEENNAHIRKIVEDILKRNPISIIIYAEFGTGVIAGAVGSPLTLVNLMQLGELQVRDMLARGSSSGENG